MTNQENTPKFGSMQEVVVKKHDLLNVLKENREKHDNIYNAACSGYWDQLNTKLEIKKKEFGAALEDIKKDFKYCFVKADTKIKNKEQINCFETLRSTLSFNNNFGLTYPSCHQEDYNKIIKMIELSVYDEFKLNTNEFNNYVMNDWSWKAAFIAGGYSNVIGGNNIYIAGSGCASPYSSITGAMIKF